MQAHLEAELLAFLRPDESAAALLARTYVEPLLTGMPLLDQHVALRPGNVLEVSGPAGVGKTEILVQIAVTCILPPCLRGVPLGGRAENVLIFDLDCKFDLLRILQVLHSRVDQALASLGQHQVQEAEINEAVQDSLQRLHLVRCHSSFDLLASLAVIRPLMAHLVAHGGIRCILIDNIAAYHYLDKVGRGPGGGANPALGMYDITREGAPLALHRVQSAVAQELRSVAREHRVVVVATKHLLFAGGRHSDRGDLWAQREFMLRPWQELVTHRLMLRRVDSRRQQGEAAPPPCTRLAKWGDPAGDVVVPFQITEGPILLA